MSSSRVAKAMSAVNRTGIKIACRTVWSRRMPRSVAPRVSVNLMCAHPISSQDFSLCTQAPFN